MDCPHGFEPHLGWSSRCKNCFRNRNEHSATSLATSARHHRSSTSSNQYSNEYMHTQTPYRRPKLSTTITPPEIRRPSTRSQQDSRHSISFVPSALQESRRTSSNVMNYAPPDMHYSPYSSNTRLDSSLNTSSYATLPRKPSYVANTAETYSDKSVGIVVSSYATLPRKASSQSTVDPPGAAGYKRVSPNEALLKRTPSTSSMGSSTSANRYNTLNPSGYMSPAARRRWSSVSTPVTPLMRSPATTPRVRSPTRTYSPLPVVSRPYSSCSNHRYSNYTRNSSRVTSPAFSLASSRRSSIGHEDHLNDATNVINRDPFLSEPASVSSKYSTCSLPRNFSVQHSSGLDRQPPPAASPRPGSDGIQRKYRRTHRQPIPVFEGKCSNEGCSSDSAAAKRKCSNEGCANNNKSFVSALVECWKCKQSSPGGGEYNLYEPVQEAPLATVEDISSHEPVVVADNTGSSVVFGNTLKTLRKRARKKSASPKNHDKLSTRETTPLKDTLLKQPQSCLAPIESGSFSVTDTVAVSEVKDATNSLANATLIPEATQLDFQDFTHEVKASEMDASEDVVDAEVESSEMAVFKVAEVEALVPKVLLVQVEVPEEVLASETPCSTVTDQEHPEVMSLKESPFQASYPESTSVEDVLGENDKSTETKVKELEFVVSEDKEEIAKVLISRESKKVTSNVTISKPSESREITDEVLQAATPTSKVVSTEVLLIDDTPTQISIPETDTTNVEVLSTQTSTNEVENIEIDKTTASETVYETIVVESPDFKYEDLKVSEDIEADMKDYKVAVSDTDAVEPTDLGIEPFKAAQSEPKIDNARDAKIDKSVFYEREVDTSVLIKEKSPANEGFSTEAEIGIAQFEKCDEEALTEVTNKGIPLTALIERYDESPRKMMAFEEEKMESIEEGHLGNDFKVDEVGLTATPQSLLKLLSEDTVGFTTVQNSEYFSTYDNDSPPSTSSPATIIEVGEDDFDQEWPEVDESVPMVKNCLLTECREENSVVSRENEKSWSSSNFDVSGDGEAKPSFSKNDDDYTSETFLSAAAGTLPQQMKGGANLNEKLKSKSNEKYAQDEKDSVSSSSVEQTRLCKVFQSDLQSNNDVGQNSISDNVVVEETKIPINPEFSATTVILSGLSQSIPDEIEGHKSSEQILDDLADNGRREEEDKKTTQKSNDCVSSSANDQVSLTMPKEVASKERTDDSFEDSNEQTKAQISGLIDKVEKMDVNQACSESNFSEQHQKSDRVEQKSPGGKEDQSLDTYLATNTLEEEGAKINSPKDKVQQKPELPPKPKPRIKRHKKRDNDMPSSKLTDGGYFKSANELAACAAESQISIGLTGDEKTENLISSNRSSDLPTSSGDQAIGESNVTGDAQMFDSISFATVEKAATEKDAFVLVNKPLDTSSPDHEGFDHQGCESVMTKERSLGAAPKSQLGSHDAVWEDECEPVNLERRPLFIVMDKPIAKEPEVRPRSKKSAKQEKTRAKAEVERVSKQHKSQNDTKSEKSQRMEFSSSVENDRNALSLEIATREKSCSDDSDRSAEKELKKDQSFNSVIRNQVGAEQDTNVEAELKNVDTHDADETKSAATRLEAVEKPQAAAATAIQVKQEDDLYRKQREHIAPVNKSLNNENLGASDGSWSRRQTKDENIKERDNSEDDENAMAEVTSHSLASKMEENSKISDLTKEDEVDGLKKMDAASSSLGLEKIPTNPQSTKDELGENEAFSGYNEPQLTPLIEVTKTREAEEERRQILAYQSANKQDENVLVTNKKGTSSTDVSLSTMDDIATPELSKIESYDSHHSKIGIAADSLAISQEDMKRDNLDIVMQAQETDDFAFRSKVEDTENACLPILESTPLEKCNLQEPDRMWNVPDIARTVILSDSPPVLTSDITNTEANIPKGEGEVPWDPLVQKVAPNTSLFDMENSTNFEVKETYLQEQKTALNFESVSLNAQGEKSVDTPDIFSLNNMEKSSSESSDGMKNVTGAGLSEFSPIDILREEEANRKKNDTTQQKRVPENVMASTDLKIEQEDIVIIEEEIETLEIREDQPSEIMDGVVTDETISVIESGSIDMIQRKNSYGRTVTLTNLEERPTESSHHTKDEMNPDVLKEAFESKNAPDTKIIVNAFVSKEEVDLALAKGQPSFDENMSSILPNLDTTPSHASMPVFKEDEGGISLQNEGNERILTDTEKSHLIEMPPFFSQVEFDSELTEDNSTFTEMAKELKFSQEEQKDESFSSSIIEEAKVKRHHVDTSKEAAASFEKEKLNKEEGLFQSELENNEPPPPASSQKISSSAQFENNASGNNACQVAIVDSQLDEMSQQHSLEETIEDVIVKSGYSSPSKPGKMSAVNEPNLATSKKVFEARSENKLEALEVLESSALRAHSEKEEETLLKSMQIDASTQLERPSAHHVFDFEKDLPANFGSPSAMAKDATLPIRAKSPEEELSQEVASKVNQTFHANDAKIMQAMSGNGVESASLGQREEKWRESGDEKALINEKRHEVTEEEQLTQPDSGFFEASTDVKGDKNILPPHLMALSSNVTPRTFKNVRSHSQGSAQDFPPFSLMKTHSQTDNSRPMSFQDLLQEKRRMLAKYMPPEQRQDNESIKPEWMSTRASIIQKSQEIDDSRTDDLQREEEHDKKDETKEDVDPLSIFKPRGSLSDWGNPPSFEVDKSETSSDGMPSLVQDFGGGATSLTPQPNLQRFESVPDLPLGEGCAFVCDMMTNTASTETINSSELESLDSTTPVNMEPEKLAPIFNKLRRKEKHLRQKSQQLESKLEMSETHCYQLVEENCELKTAIESLETEILEVQDRFHDDDATEWKRMRSEVKAMAKACRTFQLKLKKAEVQSGKLKAENAQLAKSVSQDLRRRHQSHPPSSAATTSQQVALQQQGGNEMFKSAVIWGAVLVAGYQFLKSKMN